jgi:orotidine-5'-phosphate decarboxylase
MDLIVALDVDSLAAAEEFSTRLVGAVRWVKVGLELFVAHGAEPVRALQARGFKVMLDLKLHDIPETVGRATERAAALGVDLLTVHTAGGWRMLERAAAAAGPKMKVLGVTVLTSLDAKDLARVGVTEPLEEVVVARAQLAMETGIHGVVASPAEAARIRAGAPAGFLIVTPGVRPAGAETGDQKRVATPSAAKAAGADFIVVGRPIRDAKDPRAAAQAILAEIA